MSEEERTDLKTLSKARRDDSRGRGPEVWRDLVVMPSAPSSVPSSSSISSSSSSGSFSYSAARALAEASRALIGFAESLGVSSSMSSSSRRSEGASSLSSPSAAGAFWSIDAAAFVAFASSLFLWNSSSFRRFFSSISWRSRSL